MKEACSLGDCGENSRQADRPRRQSIFMEGANSISSKLLFLKILTGVTVATNITLLLAVIPAILLLRSRLDQRDAQACGLQTFPSGQGQLQDSDVLRPHGAGDVISPSDVSGGDEGFRRYCFKAERKGCLERDYSLKTEGEGENQTQLCCGDLGDHLYGVMSEKLSEKLQSDVYRTHWLQKVKKYITKLHSDSQEVTNRPAAHVGISPTGNLTGTAPRIQWDHSGEVSFLTGGVINDGDRLTITQPGYYYVYAGLQFHVKPSTDSDHPLIAFLYRTVNGTRESQRKLMTSRESSCGRTRGAESGPVSMYMAGIFLLRQNDEVSVRTIGQNLLDRTPTRTYLGLHMV